MINDANINQLRLFYRRDTAADGRTGGHPLSDLVGDSWISSRNKIGSGSVSTVTAVCVGRNKCI